MALFRRKKESAADALADESTAEAVEEADVAREEEIVETEPARPTGPWDEADVSDEDPRIDLGGLRLKGVDGLELRLEVDRGTEKVIAATAVAKGGQVQLQAFAAPRKAGLWDGIRAEISSSIIEAGGTAEEADGRFGVELVARVPSPDRPGTFDPARFAGVDGPRWFLRALFSGKAVGAGPSAALLEQVVADAVVVRGHEAMAPRDPLPLHLPDAAPEPPVEGQTQPTLEGLKRRGPEITEIH